MIFDHDSDPIYRLILRWQRTNHRRNCFCILSFSDRYDNMYVNDPQSGPNGSGMPRVQKFDTNGHFITKAELV
jgi:hypothetical protein